MDPKYFLKMRGHQVRWTLPAGNEPEGTLRLARWKAAALRVCDNNPKRFNEWIRRLLDAEAARILNA